MKRPYQLDLGFFTLSDRQIKSLAECCERKLSCDLLLDARVHLRNNISTYNGLGRWIRNNPEEVNNIVETYLTSGNKEKILIAKGTLSQAGIEIPSL